MQTRHEHDVTTDNSELLSNKKRGWRRAPVVWAVIGSVAGMLLLGTGYLVWQHVHATKHVASDPNSLVFPFGDAKKYQPLVHAEAGGVVRRFADTYNRIPLIVREQTLSPEELASGSSLVTNAAAAIGAKRSTVTDLGTAYIANGQAGKNNQTIVLVAYSKLIFIESNGTLKDSDWAAYLNTYQ